MTALENQSILDVAIQEDGSVFAAFDWAVENGVSITDDLVPGTLLKRPATDYRVDDVAKYFESRKQKIAVSQIPEFEFVDNYELPGELPYSF